MSASPIDQLPLHQIPEWKYISSIWKAVSFYDLFLTDNPLQFTMLSHEERIKILKSMARSKEALIAGAKEEWILNMVVRKFFEPRPMTENLACSLLDLPEAFQDAILTKMYHRTFPLVLKTCRYIHDRVFKHQHRYHIYIPDLNIRFHNGKVSVSKTPHFSNYDIFNDSYALFVFKKIIVIPEEKRSHIREYREAENKNKVEEVLRVKTYTGTMVVEHSRRYNFTHDDQIKRLKPTWLNITYLQEEDLKLIETLKNLRKVTVFPMPESELLHKLFQQVESVEVTLEAERETLLNPVFEYIKKRSLSHSPDRIHHVTVVLNRWSASLSRFLQDFKTSFVSCSGYDVSGPNTGPLNSKTRIHFLCYLFQLPGETKHCLIIQTDYKEMERRSFGFHRKTSFSVCFDIETVGHAVAFMSKRLLNSFVIDFGSLDFGSQDFKQFFGILTNYLFGYE